MKIPVLAVVGAACRDTLRFLIRHPMLLLVTAACSLPFLYGEAVTAAAPRGERDFADIAAAWPLSALACVVWLPVFIHAIRETVSGERIPFWLGAILSAATYRYGIYTIVLLLVADLMLAFPGTSWLSFAGGAAFFVAWFVILLRTTLTFTALGLGRLDLGFAQSFGMTSGQTLRLLAIVALQCAVVGIAVMVLLMIAILAGLDPLDMSEDGVPNPYSGVAIALFTEIVALMMVVAGAHIYRVLVGPPPEPQNGRY